MEFEIALTSLKEGKRVGRTGWNGKGQYIAIQRPTADGKMTLPYLYIKTVDGSLVPWIASQGDLLSNDWFEIEDL